MRIAPICLLALLLAVPAPAQDGVDAWTSEHGLPLNAIRDVHQTRDGYLWIVTMNGVARFDGVRFTVFDRTSSPGLETSRLLVVDECANGELWFGSIDGVARYQDGAFSTYTTADGLPDPLVRAVTCDDRGNVWALSGSQIVWWQGEGFTAAPGVPQEVAFVPSTWDPNVLFGQDGRTVYRFARGTLTRIPLPTELHGRVDQHFAQEQSGNLWVSLLGATLARVHPDGSFQEYSRDDRSRAERGETTGNVPATEYVTRTGRRWGFLIGRGLSRLVAVPDQAERLRVDGLEEDREGHVWLATYNRGLYRLRDQAVRIVTRQQGLPGRNVYPVLEDREGSIWAGVWDGGVSRLHDGRFTTVLAEAGAPLFPTALAQDHQGRVWIATLGENAGLHIYENGRVRPLERIVPDPTDVAAIYPDAAGAVWLGSTRGLIRYEDETVTFFTAADGLAGTDIKVIVGDGDDGLWVGGVGGVTHVRKGVFTRWTPREGLPAATVLALFLDGDGVLWIGTSDGGLVRLQQGRVTQVTTGDGLFDSGAFAILEDAGGFLWMSSNRGIYRVDKAQLNAFAEGRVGRIDSLALGRNDGLLNTQANGGAWPAGVRARDGRLWFPTQDGLAVIDPAKVGGTQAPLQPVIETVLVDQQAVAFEQGIRLAPQQRSFAVEYTALSFINSERILFRYRLRGADEAWVDAGTRRIAHYSQVRPGTYTFEVIAVSSAGIWSPTPSRLAITIVPPFWQQGWFVSALVVCAVGLAVGIYRRRVARLEKTRTMQEAFSRQLIASQEQERRRLAAELHDGLGQSLIVIRNWAALGAAPLTADAPGREELDEIARAASRAIGEMREMAHNLAPYNLERQGLADSLSEMIDRVQRASGIVFTQELEPLNGEVSRDVQTSLYRVAQEAVNNIVKHSGATAASVTLKRQNGAVQLIVSDNGRGFDPRTAARGMGLASMAERIRLFDGAYAVRSDEGRGTTVEVLVKSGGGADAS